MATTNTLVKQPIPDEHMKILEVPLPGIERGHGAIILSATGEYKAARRRSPEALEAFLKAREEQNLLKIQDGEAVKPDPYSQRQIPVPQNRTTRLLQEIARGGVTVSITEEGKLAASGRTRLVEKWSSIIFDNRPAIELMLHNIRRVHGENDPLGLWDLMERHNSFIYEARMEELIKHYSYPMAIIRCSEEQQADMKTATFPDAPSGETATHRYNLLSATNLTKMVTPQYRVKNVLPQEGTSAIFGPPGAGKTFLALDLAFAIADGRNWFGNRVKKCDVLYICLEGQSGLAQRVQAYRNHHGKKTGNRIRFIFAPFSLLNKENVDALISTVNDAGFTNGAIFIDTLSAASPGADENSSADMGMIVEATKRVQGDCGGLVVLVHHTGKDLSKGLRGHSSLAASLDTTIHVTRNNDCRAWSLAKAKDGIDGGEYAFELLAIELGIDEDGELITSCVVVERTSADGPYIHIKRPKGGNQKIVFDVAGELLRKSSHYGKGDAPASRPCIHLDDLIEACHGRLTVSEHRWRERARLAITGLVNAGCLMLRENWVWDR